MRKHLLIAVLLLIAHFAYSQEKQLLTDFKFRVQKYRAISFSGSGNNGTSVKKYPVINSSSRSTGINIGAQYYQLKSTDDVYRTMSTAFYSGFNNGTSKNAGQSKLKNTDFIEAAFLSISNTRFYNKLFTLLGTDLSADLRNSKTKTTTQLFSKRSAYPYNASISAGIGTGRLENVTDMQNALWLYKTLQEEGRLTNSLSATELNELGRTVTAAKNTRILDARRRNRFILETVDKYFQQKNILKATDIGYFSALNDILFFAINNQRLSGTQKYITITPGINKGDDKFITYAPPEIKTTFDSYIKSVTADIGIKTYKPVNLKHQNNYGASVTLQYMDEKTTDERFEAGILISALNVKETTKKAGLNIFYQHEIYPNTRTAINLAVEAEGGYFDLNNYADGYAEVRLSGNINYFINYQTVLFGGINVSYLRNIKDISNNIFYTNDFNTQLSIGLNINL